MGFQKYLESIGIRETTLNKYINAFQNIPKEIFDSAEEINLFLSRRARQFNDARLYYAVIKHYLRYKRKFEWLSLIKYPQLTKKKRTPNYYDLETIFRILENIQEENYRIAGYVQLFGGMRAFEVMQIRREDIKLFKNYAIVVVKSAKRNPYEVYLYGKGFEKLRQYLNKHDFDAKDLVFCKNTNSKDLETKIRTNVRYYQEAIRKASEVVGLKLTSHDLKRNLAKFLQKQGLSLEEIKEALHHANISTTLIYVGKISTENIKKVLENV